MRTGLLNFLFSNEVCVYLQFDACMQQQTFRTFFRSSILNSVFLKIQEDKQFVSGRMASIPAFRNGWAALYAIPDIFNRPAGSLEGWTIAFGYVF